MSQPPTSPYPPDLGDAAPGRVEFGDLVDVAAADLDWAGRRAFGLSLRRVELTGIRGAEALRGARMPWNDVLQNAPLFAALAGIEIVTDDE